MERGHPYIRAYARVRDSQLQKPDIHNPYQPSPCEPHCSPGMLSPEEQLVLDRMLINPYKKCTLDLMEELHCEMSSVYRLRARAIEKLLHLRYGAGAGE